MYRSERDCIMILLQCPFQTAPRLVEKTTLNFETDTRPATPGGGHHSGAAAQEGIKYHFSPVGEKTNEPLHMIETLLLPMGNAL